MGGRLILKRQVNYLGFLSLLSLLSVLGYFTDNVGMYGFLGFIYYARYFRVIPDELFKSNVQRACTAAWLSELIILVPITYICTIAKEGSKALGTAFGLSFATAIFIFTIVLMVLDYRESNGVFDD